MCNVYEVIINRFIIMQCSAESVWHWEIWIEYHRSVIDVSMILCAGILCFWPLHSNYEINKIIQIDTQAHRQIVKQAHRQISRCDMMIYQTLLWYSIRNFMILFTGMPFPTDRAIHSRYMKSVSEFEINKIFQSYSSYFVYWIGHSSQRKRNSVWRHSGIAIRCI